jgi:hypothetical protein
MAAAKAALTGDGGRQPPWPRPRAVGAAPALPGDRAPAPPGDRTCEAGGRAPKQPGATRPGSRATAPRAGVPRQRAGAGFPRRQGRTERPRAWPPPHGEPSGPRARVEAYGRRAAPAPACRGRGLRRQGLLAGVPRLAARNGRRHREYGVQTLTVC